MSCACGTGLLCSTNGYDGISEELMLSGNSMNNPKGLHGLPQELFEPPGIAGLPVLEWKPGHGQPTQRIQAGRPELPQEIKQVILDVLLFLMVTSLAI